MKHEKLISFLTAAVVAFVTAWGAVGCLTTAFALQFQYADLPVLACGLGALIGAAFLSFRRGGTVLLCLLALAAGYSYQDGTAAEQLMQLIFRLTTIYDRAYGWGIPFVLEQPWDAGFADWPLGMLGAAIALAVAWTILRQGSVWLPMLTTILPLCACIVVTDTVPAAFWLMMVMAGLILLLLTAGVRQENAGQGIRLLLGSALPVILAVLTLFYLVPQDGYVNRSEVLRENIIAAAENIPKLMETGLNQIASGFQKAPSRTVDLAGLGARIPFTYPVMNVTAEKSGTLYLRERDYDLYDGLGWTASEGRSESFASAAGETETIRIETAARKNIRYLPYYPAMQTALVDGNAENPQQQKEYTVLRSSLPDNWRQTVYQNAAGSPEEWRDYCVLPESTRKEAEAILNGSISETDTPAQKADIIAALVTDSARYDLNAEKMPSHQEDFAVWFLREGESGYCVHFATAATVLLRAAGVPARYVTGYMLEAVAGETVTVTEENAHAWAEYYEPNLGLWLPLEATPAAEAPIYATDSRIPSTQPVQPEEIPPETTWGSTEATVLPSESAGPTPAVTVPEVIPEEKPQRRFPMRLLYLPLLILVLILQRDLRLRLRAKRQMTGTPNARALQHWRETVRLTRLLKQQPPEELFGLAQKAKYSQHVLTEEELQRFVCLNRQYRDDLGEKSWYLRLIYRYIFAIY